MSTAVVDNLKKFAGHGIAAQKAVDAVIEKTKPQQREELDLAVALIVPSRTNRQAVVTEDFLESIRKAGGVMQNILVRPIKATAAHVTPGAPFAIGDKIHELVSGERRWRASQKLGYSTIPAVVKELTDTQALELQISENKDRQDLNDMEKSRQYNLLAEQYIADARKAGNTKYAFKDAVTDISNRYTESHRTVYETLQLKQLTVVAKGRLDSGWMTRSHAVKLCGRTQEEQEKLLLWLAGQAEHSNGDIPSVRRLQREIELLDQQNEARKKQEKLFTEPAAPAGKIAGSEASSDPEANVSAGKSGSGVTSASAATAPVKPIGRVTFDGKTIELLPGPLPASIVAELRRIDPDRSPEIVRGEVDPKLNLGPIKLFSLYGGYTINTVAHLQKMLTAPVQTPAPAPKPLSAAQLKKQQEEQARHEELYRKRQLKAKRQQQIALRADVKLFTSLVSKLQLNHRTLTRVIPPLLMEFHDDGDFHPGMFAPQVLGWPAPKDPDYKGDYDYQEIRTYAKKHTKKFTPGLLAALLLYNRTPPAEIERLARYFSIDPKKLRAKATAELKAEELKAREPKKPETREEKQLHAALHRFAYAVNRWNKLRKKGATDPQLREAIQREIGNDGGTGSMSKGFVCYMRQYQGPNNPAVWFNHSTRSGKPSLQGAALVEAVRKLLNIPYPGDVEA